MVVDEGGTEAHVGVVWGQFQSALQIGCGGRLLADHGMVGGAERRKTPVSRVDLELGSRAGNRIAVGGPGSARRPTPNCRLRSTRPTLMNILSYGNSFRAR